MEAFLRNAQSGNQTEGHVCGSKQPQGFRHIDITSSSHAVAASALSGTLWYHIISSCGMSNLFNFRQRFCRESTGSTRSINNCLRKTGVCSQVVCVFRQLARSEQTRQDLEAKVMQLTLDLQHSTALLSRSEQDLQSKAWEVQRVQAELIACLASTPEAKPHMSPSQDHRRQHQLEAAQHQAETAQQQGLFPDEVDEAAAKNAELEMLKEQLHDSVELLEQAERQLKAKVSEVDACKASLQETQQELEQSRQQLHEAQMLLEEHAELLQQHNSQLLQAHEQLHNAETRYALPSTV